MPAKGFGSVSLSDDVVRKIDRLARDDPAEPSRAQVITRLVNEALSVPA